MSLMSLRAVYGPNAQHHPSIPPLIITATDSPPGKSLKPLIDVSFHPLITCHYCFLVLQNGACIPYRAMHGLTPQYAAHSSSAVRKLLEIVTRGG